MQWAISIQGNTETEVLAALDGIDTRQVIRDQAMHDGLVKRGLGVDALLLELDGDGAHVVAREQLEGAIAAAKALVAVVALAEDQYAITLSGFADAGHEHVDGGVAERVSVVVNRDVPERGPVVAANAQFPPFSLNG